MQYFFLSLLLVFNIITFVMYGVDKAKAKLDGWRISEKTLLIWSLLGGVGGIAGMNTFRHKTRKPKFKAANIVGLLVNIFLTSLVFMAL
jgi:uncharacterized membrane protein YsdA (DUF1294 family)